jgi:hypothetical protein
MYTTNDQYMSNTTIITMVVVFSLFLFIVLANTIVYAQQVPPPPSNIPSPTSPKLHAVKIISPTKGQQIPASKDLTISGTSIDNATSNCQVSMNVNRVKPYQPATAAGTGGANDYSKWNFLLTSNYTTIKPGPDNRITAKYSCTDNPSTVSYSSVNVTGVVVTAAAAPAANTTTAYPKQQQQQQNMMTTTSNKTAITTSNGNTNKITAQSKPSLTMGKNNATAIVNSGSTPTLPPLPPPLPPPVSTPTNTPGSGKLLHLGGGESGSKSDNTKTVAHRSSSNSESGSKSDNTKTVAHRSSSNSESGSKSDNTKTVAHRSSSNNNNSEDNSPTAKVKTQRTSSDKLSKAITTIDEQHHIKPVNSKSKTSHNNGGKSKDIGEHINSKFGDSDPLSNALDHMSDTLDHLFG